MAHPHPEIPQVALPPPPPPREFLPSFQIHGAELNIINSSFISLLLEVFPRNLLRSFTDSLTNTVSGRYRRIKSVDSHKSLHKNQKTEQITLDSTVVVFFYHVVDFLTLTVKPSQAYPPRFYQ